MGIVAKWGLVLGIAALPIGMAGCGGDSGDKGTIIDLDVSVADTGSGDVGKDTGGDVGTDTGLGDVGMLGDVGDVGDVGHDVGHDVGGDVH